MNIKVMNIKSNEKCRLCSCTTYLKNIFSCDGLQQSIQNYAHIHIDREDVLPTMVCDSCHGKIKRFQKFVDKAHGIQAELLKDYKCKSGSKSKSRKRSHSTSEEKWKVETDVVELLTDDESNSSSSFEASENEDSDVEFVSIETDVVHVNRCPKYMDVKEEPLSMHPESPQPEFKPELGSFMKNKNIQVGETLEELRSEDGNTKRTSRFCQEKGTAISKDDLVNKSSQVMVVSEPTNTRGLKLRLSRHQVQIMEQHFSDHWARFTAPTLLAVADFLHQVNGEFRNVSITRVRNYFVNRKYRCRR